MPLARISVSVNTDSQKKALINKQFSLMLSEKLNKPENYVQVIFESELTISFAGTAEPSAFIEIKSIGGLLPQNCKAVSEAACHIIEKELKIPSKRVYIEFSDIKAPLWGWNMTTFG